jgi:acyl-CoA synthetase (NDP forming)
VAKEDAGSPMLLFGESVPTYAFPESAARVLGKVAGYADWRAGPHGIIPDFDGIAPAVAREACQRALAAEGEGWLPPREVGAVLGAIGLPVAPDGVAPGAGPVTEDALPDAAAGKEIPVRVSMLEDPSFGPLIVFGLGGVFLDLVADTAVRVTPLTDRAAAAMVREIRAWPLLAGQRGHPPADIEALQDMLLRVSRLVEEVPDIAEIELNPVLLGPPGRGGRIVGARIRVAPPRKGQAARYTTAVLPASRGGAAAAPAGTGNREGGSDDPRR